MILDDLDKRILAQLQHDASLTNHALATLVHASPPTCLRRVNLLIKEGIIARQVAILAPEKVGAALTAIVEITLDHQATEKQIEFEKLVAHEVAVKQCYRVSPGPDFCLIVNCADMPAYLALTNRLFTQDANVRNVKTFFSVKRTKFEPKINIAGVFIA